MGQIRSRAAVWGALGATFVVACGIELTGGTVVEPRGGPDASSGQDGGQQDTGVVPGDAEPDAAPLPFPTIVQLATGVDRACVLEARGTLKCWGRNADGQLGLGDTNARGDNGGEMGTNLPNVDLGAGARVVQVALGGRHTCAILGDGAVKCWGYNATGELGLGDLTTRGDNAGAGKMGDALAKVNLGAGRTAKQLALGYEHTCAILDTNALKCWGYNATGQLGTNDKRSRGGATTDMAALAVINLGNGRTAKSVAAGSFHTCAILDNDDLKCWGSNSAGQLGYGDTSDRGDAGNEMGDALTAIDLGGGHKARAVAAGEQHTCALLDDATVKCWGNAYYGQCGTGDTNDRGDRANEMGEALRAIDLGQGHKAKGLALGANHTCIVLDNDELRCFGAGFDAQLGPLPGGATSWGWTIGQMGPNLASLDLGPGAKVTSASGGATHTCALLGNSVKCFGKNAAGCLGQGDTTLRGRVPGDMGAALLPVSLF